MKILQKVNERLYNQGDCIKVISMAQTVNVMVEGGKASSGPPLGPALGPLGLNLGDIIKQINEKTKAFQGMQVPVSVVVTDPAKKLFEIKVGIPPTSALIKKELGIESGSGKRKEQVAGNATMEQIKNVAKAKMDGMLAKDLKGAVMEVLGSCVSLGVNVEGKDAKEVQKLIKEGKMQV
jgi:large subunit ribosomal protein L11